MKTQNDTGLMVTEDGHLPLAAAALADARKTGDKERRRNYCAKVIRHVTSAADPNFPIARENRGELNIDRILSHQPPCSHLSVQAERRASYPGTSEPVLSA